MPCTCPLIFLLFLLEECAAESTSPWHTWVSCSRLPFPTLPGLDGFDICAQQTKNELNKATIINVACFFFHSLCLEQLTLSSMMGKEMSMNASFTVEIYRRKKHPFHRGKCILWLAQNTEHSLLRKSERRKRKWLFLLKLHTWCCLPSRIPFFPSQQLHHFIVNACCKQVVLELVLEVLFCFFLICSFSCDCQTSKSLRAH